MAKIFGYHIKEIGSHIELYLNKEEIAFAVLVKGVLATVEPESEAVRTKLEAIQEEIREDFKSVGIECPENSDMKPTDYLIQAIQYLNRAIQKINNASPNFEGTPYLNVFVKDCKDDHDCRIAIYASCGEPISKIQAKKMPGIRKRWDCISGPKFDGRHIMLGSVSIDGKERKRRITKAGRES